MNALVDAVEVFGRGYSWGGYESLLVPVYPERSVAPCEAEGVCSESRPDLKTLTT